MNVTAHFTDVELRCKHCGELRMNPAFLQKLELLRVAFGKPMVITSGYRCEKHNAAVSDGKQMGAHTLGQAVDVAVSGIDVQKLLMLAFDLGFTGFGIKQHGPGSGRYVHIDTVPSGEQEIVRPMVWTYP